MDQGREREEEKEGRIDNLTHNTKKDKLETPDQTSEKQGQNDHINGQITAVDPAASQEDGDQEKEDYVHGITLLFIVVALALSVFLAALDLVCLYP